MRGYASVRKKGMGFFSGVPRQLPWEQGSPDRRRKNEGRECLDSLSLPEVSSVRPSSRLQPCGPSILHPMRKVFGESFRLFLSFAPLLRPRHRRSVEPQVGTKEIPGGPERSKQSKDKVGMASVRQLSTTSVIVLCRIWFQQRHLPLDMYCCPIVHGAACARADAMFHAKRNQHDL